eukprot:m.22384 g.22384  ORF g.22384 m.22384 type:complete len:628 (+) comp8386_c0_seq2:125-2008(+)
MHLRWCHLSCTQTDYGVGSHRPIVALLLACASMFVSCLLRQQGREAHAHWTTIAMSLLSQHELSRTWLLWQRGKPTTATWHNKRRAEIIKAHPEVTTLIGGDARTAAVSIGLSLSQFGLAWYVGTLSWPVVVGCAATVGALIAFDLQALNHELSHQRVALSYAYQRMRLWLRPSKPATQPSPTSSATKLPLHTSSTTHTTKPTVHLSWARQTWLHIRTWWHFAWCNKATSNVAGIVASSMTAGPWYAYYFAGGHENHHLHAGSPYDIDGEALFWIWEQVPAEVLDSPLGTLLWCSVAALLLPIAYFASLIGCFIKYPVANALEMVYATIDFSATALVHYAVACLSPSPTKSLVFLYLSSAFSVGLLCHPLIAFWISQHQCVSSPPQSGLSAEYLHSTACNPQQQQQTSKMGLAHQRHGGAYGHTLPQLIHALVEDGNYVFEQAEQATLSYYGSRWWNWLTMNELLHVEHHDFAHIPWTRLPALRAIAPEFYSNPQNQFNHQTQSFEQRPEISDASTQVAQQTPPQVSRLSAYYSILVNDFSAQLPSDVAGMCLKVTQDDQQKLKLHQHPLAATVSITSLFSQLIIPWITAGGAKFDFACRKSNVAHVRNRYALLQRLIPDDGVPTDL